MGTQKYNYRLIIWPFDGGGGLSMFKVGLTMVPLVTLPGELNDDDPVSVVLPWDLPINDPLRRFCLKLSLPWGTVVWFARFPLENFEF